MKEPSEELSGLELREAVAREVMGYVPHPKIRQCYKRPNHPVECWDGLDSVGGVPHYESSIEAAFQIVDAMHAKGFIFDMESEYEAGKIVWRVNFGSPHICYCWGGGMGPTHKTAALGIARAALQAMRAAK